MKKSLFMLAALAAVMVSCEKVETDNGGQDDVIVVE